MLLTPTSYHCFINFFLRQANTNYKYDVFISYRHREPDASIARALHKLLEEYKVPAGLESSMKWRQRSFIDREELAGADLSDSIIEAIKSSYCLISVCSSATKDSPWCMKEIELFRKLHKDDRIFVLLIEGEPEEVFPDVIKNLKKSAESDERKELLAADIRPLSLMNQGEDTVYGNEAGDFSQYIKESLAILKSTEIHRIMAGIYGVSYGDIKQRQRERKMKLWLIASGLISAFLVVFASSMIWMYLQALKAERVAKQQTILMTLNYADDALEKGDRAGALLIAKKAMEDADSSMSRIDYINALNYSVLNRSLINEPFTSIARVKTGKKSPFFVISKNSDKVIALGEGRNINIWNIKNAAHEKSLEAEYNISSIVENPASEEIFCSLFDGSLIKYDINSGRNEAVYTSESYYSEMRISGNGKTLIGLSYLTGGRRIEMIDIESRKKLYGREFDDEDVFSYSCISKDSRYFTYITSKGSITRVNTSDGSHRNLLEGDGDSVNARNIDYDDGGRLYYVMGNELYVFKEDGSHEIRELESNARSIEVSGDTLYMDMGGLFGIALYDLEKQNIKGYLSGNNGILAGMTINEKTGDVAAVWSDKKLSIWRDIHEGDNKVYKEINIENMAELNNFKFSPDGLYLIISFNDGSLSFMDTRGSIKNETLNGKAVAQSDNLLHVLMEYKGNLSIYNMNTKVLKDIGSPGEDYINLYTAYAISRDGRFAAASNVADRSVMIMDTENNKKLVIQYQGVHHLDFIMVSDIIFSGDAKSIYIMYSSNEIIEYSLEDGLMKEMPYDTGLGVNAFLCDDEQKYMALNFVDNTFKIIDAGTKEELLKGDGKVYSIAAEGEDFKLIGIADDDIFYSSRYEEPVIVSTNNLREGGDDNMLNTNSISPDLRYLLTTVADKNVVMTDAATGVFIKEFFSDTNIYQKVFFGPDSDRIIYQSGEESSRIEYILPEAELVKMSEEILSGRELGDEELEKIGKER